MTLTQQFILISIFPLSFVGITFYFIRAKLKRRRLFVRWLFTLLAATVWASSILRFYGGSTVSQAVVYSWGVIGRYGLSLTGLGILWTTLTHLSVPRAQRFLTMGLGLILLGVAIGLDPVVWAYDIVPIVIAEQLFNSFYVWAAIWVASWLMPVVAAWILTQHVSTNLPASLYRNQIHYWLLFLSLFAVGGMLASVQAPRQPGWQGSGLFVVIPAVLIGTISLIRGRLPDLQLASRQLLSRLAGTLIIFALTWLALTGINQTVADLPPNSGQDLIFIVAALLFAVLFTLVYRWVNELTHRLFLPAGTTRDVVVSDYANTIGNLPEPKQLAHLFLRLIQSNIGTDDAWFFVTEDGPGGKLVIRPLAQIGSPMPEVVDFEHTSPFAQHLRQNRRPLIQHDINSLIEFDEMIEAEKQILEEWQRTLFIPLQAGDTLVGLLALGPKYSGESYERHDFEMLQSLSIQISPLLAQAQNLASLGRINHYVFQQNQVLARDKQHLKELTHLYAEFIKLLSPDLRQPFVAVHESVQRLQNEVVDSKKPLVNQLQDEIAALKAPIENLINVSARIQKRTNFHFEPLQLNEVGGNAIRNLKTMAAARRIKVEFEPHLPDVAVLGDREQLIEATQHLLHNAIKFNKIGGVVRVECGVAGDEVYLHVVDTGVGIPEERLASIWSGFSRFHNGRNGSTSFAKGAGLGLTLANFIISAHNGRVEVESKYGSGSRFGFYLPLILDES